MADGFPDYEHLGPVGPHDADPEAEAFYQTQIWLHRPCGGVVADRPAHDGWCGDEPLARRLERRQRVRGDEPLEQRLLRLRVELRRDLLAELRGTGGLR